MMSEEAKAVQETAKLGQEIVKQIPLVAQFLGDCVTGFADISGISAWIDKRKFQRLDKFVELATNANQKLKSCDIQGRVKIPLKILEPIFENGTLEDDESLQELWTNLLANAMNPMFNDEIKYAFIDMIKNITSREAVILKLLYNTLKRQHLINNISSLSEYSFIKQGLIDSLAIQENEYLVSIHNLMRIQCVAPAILKGGVSLGSEPITIYKGTDAIVLTPLGLKFIEACIVETTLHLKLKDLNNAD